MRQGLLLRRGATIAVSSALLVGATASTAQAHGIGGRADLPVPLSYFIVGAGAALVISFVALAALWPEPRLQGIVGRPVAGRWVQPASTVLRWIGLTGLLLVVAAGFLDGRSSTRNVGPVLVWVYFWLVVPFLVALVGNVWPWLSPWRTIGRLLRPAAAERRDAADKLGVWPATLAFVGFVWLELVAPDSADPGFLAWAAVGYTVYLLAMIRWLGVETGLGVADAFETYNGLLGAISPIAYPGVAQTAQWEVSVGGGQARRHTARASEPVRLRPPLAGLAMLPVRPGLTLFVVSMIATVTYDGMSGTEWWRDLTGGVGDTIWFQTAALIGTVAAIWVLYMGASWVAARIAGPGEWTASHIAAQFAHTLVPIALAYAFAHYFTLVVFEGQTLLHAASDPFGLGWNLLGTADWRIVFFLSPTAIWYVQVATIVIGHIGGVVLAHDRALAEFDGETAVRTQYAMLVLMVALTSLGLFVLAG